MFRNNNRNAFGPIFASNRNIQPTQTTTLPSQPLIFSTSNIFQTLRTTLPQVPTHAPNLITSIMNNLKKTPLTADTQPQLTWPERMKAIKYGESYLKKYTQGEINWDNYSTPCIPDKWIDKWSVDSELISEVIMYGYSHRNVFNGSAIRKQIEEAKELRATFENTNDLTTQRELKTNDTRQLLANNADAMLYSASNCTFVHLKISKFSDLLKAKDRVEDEIGLEKELLESCEQEQIVKITQAASLFMGWEETEHNKDLTNKINMMKEHAAILTPNSVDFFLRTWNSFSAPAENDKNKELVKKFNSRLTEANNIMNTISAIVQRIRVLKERKQHIILSIKKLEAETQANKYIPLFVKWYEVTYLITPFDSIKSTQLMNQIKEFNLPENDIKNIQDILKIENKMLFLKQNETALGTVDFKHIKEKLQGGLLIEINKLRETMPKMDEMSETAQIILKYIRESELTHQIELFVSTQEKLAKLKKIDLPSQQQVGLTDGEYRLYCASETEIQENDPARLIETMNALEISIKLLRGAMLLNDIGDEDQTYHELVEEVSLYETCYNKIQAKITDNKEVNWNDFFSNSLNTSICQLRRPELNSTSGIATILSDEIQLPTILNRP